MMITDYITILRRISALSETNFKMGLLYFFIFFWINYVVGCWSLKYCWFLKCCTIETAFESYQTCNIGKGLERIVFNFFFLNGCNNCKIL
jgi:hypothetical protein